MLRGCDVVQLFIAVTISVSHAVCMLLLLQADTSGTAISRAEKVGGAHARLMGAKAQVDKFKKNAEVRRCGLTSG